MDIELKKTWDQFYKIPMGKKVFSKFLSFLVPYTGTLNLEVLEITSNYARVKMKERRHIKNHLNSVHAAALMNFAESASGLLLNYNLKPNKKAILVSFKIDYLKKARGILVAECQSHAFEKDFTGEIILESVVKNSEDVIVAKSQATWLINNK